MIAFNSLTPCISKDKCDPRRCSRLSFRQTPKKRLQARMKTPVIQGNSKWHSACNREAWHLRENKRDLKNRKRFGWTDDDTTAYWPHAAGAYRRIESANKGRGDERHAGLERSQPGRLGCHSLPRKLPNGRHLSRPLFPLCKQLDRQRAVQRPITFAENSTIRLEDNKIVEHWDVLETMLPGEQWKNTNGKF